MRSPVFLAPLWLLVACAAQAQTTAPRLSS